MSAPAARRWRDALAEWAIPEEILERAPESPWGFPVELFASRAEAAVHQLTFSNQRALEALPEGGTVLDVGCGGGAAALPLASKAALLVGVDSSPAMLEAFRDQARSAGIRAETVEGRWPDVAGRTPVADVVVCHHVAYNAPDLRTFAERLTDHARLRVVTELTATHPLSGTNPLWQRFHGVVRPSRPTAADAEAVLREAGLEPSSQEWTAPRPGGFARREDLVASVRRQLCLPAERDPEIERAIAPRVVQRNGRWGFEDRPVVTLWWAGPALPEGTSAPPG
jgi:SAM-dependent methyltransferase